MVRRDPYLERLLAEADERLRGKDFARALEILDKADKDFPHQRDVLARRDACLKRLGRKSFAYGHEEKERHRFGEIANAISWDQSEIVDRHNTPVRRISRAGDAIPSMVDPLEQAVEAPTPYTLERERPKQLVPLVLLVCYFGFAVIFALRGPVAGDVEYFAGIPFVWIPPASQSELEALGTDDSELRALKRGYWISQAEISIPEWERIAQGREIDTGGITPLPKTGVTFEQANEYARALSRTGAGSFRLPTREEWMWAAIAGNRNSAPDRLGPLEERAWYSDNSESRPQPIGQRAPNRWNLYDMLGNAAEWVDTIPENNEVGVFPERSRLLMGGSFRSLEYQLDFSTGEKYETTAHVETAGVRLLREESSGSGPAQRVLSFPPEIPIGTLQVNGQRFGDAVGEVIVLSSDEVTLSIFSSNPVDLSPLAKLEPDAIQILNIHHPKIDAESLIQLDGLTKLRELNLSGTPVRGVPSFLNRYTELRVLNLENTLLEGTGLERLASLETLRHLDLQKNPRIDSGAIESLGKLKHLETLNLTATAIAIEELTDLQLALPACDIIPEPTGFTPAERLYRASLGGEYSLLLHQLTPSAGPDRSFVIDGYQERTTLGAYGDLTPGHWVYVNPYWYVWKYHGASPQPDAQPWIGANLVGPPKLDGTPTDRNLWAPGVPAGESPWLIVEFPDFVEPADVEVHWTTMPSPIRSVTVYSESGDAIVFASPNTSQYSEWSNHFVEHITPSEDFESRHRGIRTNRIRIEFAPSETGAHDSPAFAIDAIALMGRFGRSLWASAAAASSSFEITQSPADTESNTEELAIVPPEKTIPPQLRGIPGLLESLFAER